MQRQSRADVKMSYIPRINLRAGSMDRASGAGSKPGRSASVGIPRFSRDTSANKKTKAVARARSQAPNMGDHLMTPSLKPIPFPRMTTTPQRTPSGDRSGKNYMKSLERVQACVTIKDRRPLTNTVWQRNELSRIQNILAARSSTGAEGGAPAVMRPLTIAKFVDAVAQLMSVFISDKHNVTITNYVTKLPHLSKKLLYPGVVSKSWLKTVNTLHTFPNALGLISYLVDLVQQFEAPVTDEWLYTDHDELSKLKRTFLEKCWEKYNNNNELGSVEDEYINSVRQLLGVDDEKVQELEKAIGASRALLDDPSEAAAREDEARRQSRVCRVREALAGERALEARLRAQGEAARASHADLQVDMAAARQRYDASCAEAARLKEQLSEQSMSVKERTSLMEKIDYSRQVSESKRRLLEQLTEMTDKKDMELSRLQMEAMNMCVGYNHCLINLTSERNCMDLVVDERDLIQESTLQKLSSNLSAVGSWHTQLAQKVRDAERNHHADMRRRSQESTRLMELQKKREDLRTALETESKQWRLTRQEHTKAMAASEEEMRAAREEASRFMKQAEVLTAKAHEQTDKWTKQEAGWQEKLEALRLAEAAHKVTLKEKLEHSKSKRLNLAKQLLSSFEKLLSDTVDVPRSTEALCSPPTRDF